MVSWEKAQAARVQLDKIFSQIGGTAFYLGSGLVQLDHENGWAIKVYTTDKAVQPADIPFFQDDVPILLYTDRNPKVVMQGTK